MNKNILLDICNISIEAGLITNKYYKQKNKIINKADNSPLTKADIDSNEFIIKSLSEINPKFPILSEEKFVEWDIRKKWSKYWLVDPLDGTKEFIKESGEYTVNIALIENNEPILGVIYAPALDRLFFSKKNNGSYKINTNDSLINLSNALLIKVNNKIKEQVKIIGSRSHSDSTFSNWIDNNYDN